jgi:hypothetical protein
MVLLTSSLALAGSPPKPEQSEFLVTEGGGFITKDGAGVMYAMTFGVRKVLTAPLYAVIAFENPSNNKVPLFVQSTLQPGQQELLVDSPAILRIKNGATYKVDVLLYSDEAHTKKVGNHEQKILFNIPPDMASALGVDLI